MNRNYCFTLNNYTETEVEQLKAIGCSYILLGREVGEQGTPHIQGYVEFENSKRLTTLKKINPRIHWEPRKGTQEQAIEYCKKDNRWEEYGKKKEQGQRKDLDAIKDDILKGKKVDELAIENPEIVHQYGRTLDRIEDIALRKQFRTEMTQGVWLWGETAVGKSHIAFDGYNPETHYLWANDGKWWDGYRGQEIVIMNDFRGEIAYNELLQLIDKWPYKVPRRGREPMPFVSKKVIITSSLPPEKIYKSKGEDKLEQLLRRLTVTEVVRG